MLTDHHKSSVVWPLGVVVSAVLYLLFNVIWPTIDIKPTASAEAIDETASQSLYGDEKKQPLPVDGI